MSYDFESKIIDFLKENINPYLIILFGSYVKGNFRPDSDIDIAFLSDNKFTNYELFMLAQELADILKYEVDLINLDNASTVFKAQILGTGKIIYCTDDTRRKFFTLRAFKEYALLNEERKVILDRYIKERDIDV